jgi:hypothetical protein
MNLVLLVSNDCKICVDAEKAFRHEYKKQLDSGEADIVNLDEDEKAQQIWMENDLPLAPTMIVIADNLQIITVLNPDEIINRGTEQALPAGSAGPAKGSASAVKPS